MEIKNIFPDATPEQIKDAVAVFDKGVAEAVEVAKTEAKGEYASLQAKIAELEAAKAGPVAGARTLKDYKVHEKVEVLDTNVGEWVAAHITEISPAGISVHVEPTLKFKGGPKTIGTPARIRPQE